MSDWKNNLERKLTKKFLSPNAVRDGFIESYCLLIKGYQQKEGTFTSDSDINQKTFSLVREIYRENDIHYEIPPKPVILRVNELIKKKLNMDRIQNGIPEAYLEHEKTCRELLSRMDE
ncbi:MAG: hypothetical protein ACYDBV_00820 [Nitrospiria bacterium]